MQIRFTLLHFCFPLLLSLPHARAQTEALPQPARSIDYMRWYSSDLETTDGMVYISPPDGAVMLGRSPFWILEHEVCNKQWLEYLDSDVTLHPPVCTTDLEGFYTYYHAFAWRGKAYPPGQGGLPVTGITANQATAFCRWRSKVTGILHRLPTEEEWDIATGHEPPALYPWGDELGEMKSLPLARHPQVGPDPIYAYTDDVTSGGVRFMLGNVSEFTASPDGLVVVRGSAYSSSFWHGGTNYYLGTLRYRSEVARDHYRYSIGFRYIIPVDGDGNLMEYRPNEP